MSLSNPITASSQLARAGQCEMSSNYPFEAQVTLRGPERLLQNLRPSEVPCRAQSAGQGERTF